MTYEFDRFLRYDELVAWLHEVAAAHPQLVTLETYGRSHEGRELWLVAVTDSATGAHDTKPAHWVDASIHAVELTATVAACYLVERLVTGYASGDEDVVRALRTRTFYIAPRVNPDGAEWVLADRPRFRRSSTRPWPWRDAHQWPGLHIEDVDGDGRILSMRRPDPNGGWMPHPDDARVMVPVPMTGAPAGIPTYRILLEGTVADYDGFTIPTPRQVEGLDLNRNFPAGWTTNTPGAGDHPLSEPEIDALVRAVAARPNVCGYNAFHTSGGVVLRPSSTRPDSDIEPMDIWVWKQFGEAATSLTGYAVHGIYADFTWDTRETMSGAADDWAYDHLGVYSWTTEFWDIVEKATGKKQSTHFWYTGPTADEALAVLRWCDEHHPDGHVDWYTFDHPQLGAVELGGWNWLSTWTNPPESLLRDEVAGHAEFAIRQALCSPRLELVHADVRRLGDDTWRVEAGVANTGWLPTDVSALARKKSLAKAPFAELSGDGVQVVGGPARQQFGHLEGRAQLRFADGNDGTPDRALVRWVVNAASGSELTIDVISDRTGRISTAIVLA
jgi:murein tripeptide amidase MpaA